MINLKKIFLSTGMVTLTTLAVFSTESAFAYSEGQVLASIFHKKPKHPPKQEPVPAPAPAPAPEEPAPAPAPVPEEPAPAPVPVPEEPAPSPSPEPGPVEEGVKITQSMLSFHINMNQKSSECMTYMRNFIISSVANLEDSTKIMERLLKVEDDATGQLKAIYGDEFAAKYLVIMKEHLVIATEYITAAKAVDADKTKEALTKWHANVDSLVELFSVANPNLDKAALAEISSKNLDFTVDQISARLKLDWDADITAFDAGSEQMRSLVDMVTAAIIKQFPDKFL